MNIQSVKQRFGIIGNDSLLNRAIDIAIQVAPTDISVLISGESGTGKETMPQIIHQLSARKHGPYIAVNCGAIPEGTIDSELFGHEKGSFTGAHESRKGYFEVANKGTIFLDEVAELPLTTQVRLLRVLETGEFIKVGSSKVIKTDVRIIAASNVDMPTAIHNNKFREDLFYRLNSVPILLPPLYKRNGDVHLLFRKFAVDFADKYKMPAIRLDDEAVVMLEKYKWPGNIRQLKNIVEQLSVIEESRTVGPEVLKQYLPDYGKSNLPALVGQEKASGDFTEREILYKFLYEMRADISDLKTIVLEMLQNQGSNSNTNNPAAVRRLYQDVDNIGNRAPETVNRDDDNNHASYDYRPAQSRPMQHHDVEHEEVEESLSLEDTERELIQKALRKHNNRRKNAAKELGISERTLYRKIKEYNLK